jgi:thiamine biosynthesis lipoprotein
MTWCCAVAEVRRMRPLLGTFVEIGAEGGVAVTQHALKEAFSSMEAIHNALSFQDPHSELSCLNRTPGQWVPMSRIGLQVLKLARALGVASGERFNCTVGGQLVHWGALPDHTEDKRIAIGNAQDIDIRSGAARLRRAVLVTLDGIAKGFAVDRAIAILMRHGVSSAWVNAGGDLRVYGHKRLEIVRREVEGRLQPLGYLQNGALASSFAGGQGATDLPGRMVGTVTEEADPGTVISIMANSAWRADALTKVAVATAVTERSALVSQLGGAVITPGCYS